MARAERICKTENDMVGENVFDVSRPNTLSNPFTHIKDKKTLAKRVVKDRETAIRLYGEYFDEMVKRENSEFKKEFDRMYEAFVTYDVIYLKCFCKVGNDPLHPVETCHADYIIKKLNQRLVKSKIDEVLGKRTNEEAND